MITVLGVATPAGGTEWLLSPDNETRGRNAVAQVCLCGLGQVRVSGGIVKTILIRPPKIGRVEFKVTHQIG